MKKPRLEIVPCTLRAANAYVKEHHRHHKPPQGARFALAVADEEEYRLHLSGLQKQVCQKTRTAF